MAKRSPPIPHDIGSTTPSTALAAMAASTAFPPAWRTRSAAAVASGWLVAAIPPRARTLDRVLWSGPEGRSAARTRPAIAARPTMTKKAVEGQVGAMRGMARSLRMELRMVLADPRTRMRTLLVGVRSRRGGPSHS